MRRDATNKLFLAAFACAALAQSSSASAAAPLSYELPAETTQLKPGPGAETASQCGVCHSLDYIAIQPSHMGRAFWDAEVQKMIKVYKARIDPQDAATIADYLAATY
ncbi:MAG: cytochrome c [Hyphomicrobiales bacterium]|nr:cytochrome c [Hyphomicrobiales bacterium]